MKTRIIRQRNKISGVPSSKKEYKAQISNTLMDSTNTAPAEILFLTTYPPRECGIATYSQDLIKALLNKFKNSFKIKICALESEHILHEYTHAVKYILNTDQSDAYDTLARKINENTAIQLVLIQHEFGLFRNNESDLSSFMKKVSKPVVMVFHTVLPGPNKDLKNNVEDLVSLASSIIVMTNAAANILKKEYGVAADKITVIPHGTHLVPHSDKTLLKKKHNLTGKKVLATFGLLGSGKSIETTLDALPDIVKKNKEVLFLIIGKTHPSIVKQEGEKYRQILEAKIKKLQLEDHVRFINAFLPLPDLLEYLQLTDIYLFTSKDPNQAVSGTFSYAVSCGCPIISTPIPHACEILSNNSGVIIAFQDDKQLATAVNTLLLDDQLRKNISANGLHKIAPTAWENSAIAHALLFEKLMTDAITLQYKIPNVNLDHFKKLTTPFGMIQFSKMNKPDINSGYTIDDNARAMVAMCQHYELTKEPSDIGYITIYLNFMNHCLQANGGFLNYVDQEYHFTPQNQETNLDDSNGRAIWALGYLLSVSSILPKEIVDEAQLIFQRAILVVPEIHSTRAMAFIIKGLYYADSKRETPQNGELIKILADRLVQMYRHEADQKWIWFESYLTYGNSIIPEAMLCAWMATGNLIYKIIAKSSFDFILNTIFINGSIKVVSNKGWLYKQNQFASSPIGGEQPIDVAYTILALNKFYTVFKNIEYLQKIETAFNWFLGNNHLHQIIYNPCTGGCYDGLEEDYINLNQGAESTVSYLMSRLSIAQFLKKRNEKTMVPDKLTTLPELNA